MFCHGLLNLFCRNEPRLCSTAGCNNVCANTEVCVKMIHLATSWFMGKMSILNCAETILVLRRKVFNAKIIQKGALMTDGIFIYLQCSTKAIGWKLIYEVKYQTLARPRQEALKTWRWRLLKNLKTLFFSRYSKFLLIGNWYWSKTSPKFFSKKNSNNYGR